LTFTEDVNFGGNRLAGKVDGRDKWAQAALPVAVSALFCSSGARQSPGSRHAQYSTSHDLPQLSYYSLEVKLWLDLAVAAKNSENSETSGVYYFYLRAKPSDRLL